MQEFKPSLKRILLRFFAFLIIIFFVSFWTERESRIFTFLFTVPALTFILTFYIQYVKLEQDYLIVESILSIGFGHLFPAKIKLSDITELRCNVLFFESVLGLCLDIKTLDKRIQISNFFLEQKTYNSLVETLSSKVRKDCLIINNFKSPV